MTKIGTTQILLTKFIVNQIYCEPNLLALRYRINTLWKIFNQLLCNHSIQPVIRFAGATNHVIQIFPTTSFPDYFAAC